MFIGSSCFITEYRFTKVYSLANQDIDLDKKGQTRFLLRLV